MAHYNTSPAVEVREKDLTNTIQTLRSTAGGAVGNFVWGPANKIKEINSDVDLVSVFGAPNSKNYEDWLTISSFLSYTGLCNVVRVINKEEALNGTDSGSGILIENDDERDVVATTNPAIYFASRYPGTLGNSIGVSLADSRTFDRWEHKALFDGPPNTSTSASEKGATNDELHVVVYDALGLFTGVVGSVLEQYAFLSKSFDGRDENNRANYYVSRLNGSSKYIYAFDPLSGSDVTPKTQYDDFIASITVNDGGSGYSDEPVVTIGAPDETWGVQATATATVVGGEITAITLIEPGTGYTGSAPTVTITDDTGTTATATAVLATTSPTNNATDWGSKLISDIGVQSEFASLDTNYTVAMTGGVDSTTLSAADYINAWELFTDKEISDVGLCMLGSAGAEETTHKTIVKWVRDNVVEFRKDCMAFFSPNLNDVLNKTKIDAAENVIKTRNNIGGNSSYMVMDSGWKRMYDVYNDKFRWVPLNGDIAGLCAQVDRTDDTWWSPGGYTRGVLKNVVSLAFNPDQATRNKLYKVNVNPVTTFKSDGTILFGDRTMKGKGSAFSQIGIRRLFILLEKSISNSAKQMLFEFNDEFTRARFRGQVEPFMREVQGRRGINDFKVVCDETNNTPEVIMNGEFVGSIFIKPNYSINWIVLNFVAVRRDVEFSEITSQQF